MTQTISSRAQYKPSVANDFDKFGHPGKWKKVITVSTGQTLICTGSNYGAGAIIIGNTDTTVHLSEGGSLPGTAIGANTLFEGSIEKIVNGGSGVVYVLIRNQTIR